MVRRMSNGAHLKKGHMASGTGWQDAVNGPYFPAHEVDAVLYDGDLTRIYRARRRSSGKSVILKAPRDEHEARQTAPLLNHEYEMTRRASAPGVIRVLALERYNNLPVIELEDFGGDSLDRIAKQRRLPIEELLQIAIQLAGGLSEIHAAALIHKDINPSNVVYNPETGVSKIIDFGIATHLPRQQAGTVKAELFEGSLPYISPEQTGRTNRSIDYRTDLYSFGVTLYELLTGRPLFVVSEPIEWFHCHIARQPFPPAEVDPNIPGPISDIIMKLLAKTAADRYQSALGVQADLRHCLDELAGKGRIASFDLARQDISDRFQIPQRLYGRDHEVTRLLASFEQVGNGSCKMVLVSGYSGIGKTSLIKELYNPITERRGHFVSGKFDQLHRNIPYSALAAALRDLVRQLLTESEAALARWRTKILDAVGANGQLIIDIIGELELIIGPQPGVPETLPTETEQRFHPVFQRFVQVFCGPDHPLTVFLDDLQWIDNATMRLLDMLSSGESGPAHLLFIGAYRDNEVQPGHLVALWLRELRQREVAFEEIHLGPLSREHLTDLLADTLKVDRGSVAALAQIVENKTAGNPFFTEEFLKALHQSGAIQFSHAQGCWTWDIGKIHTQQMTDNVVDLMTAKLRRLTPSTLELLKLGACIGFRFSLDELTVVSEASPAMIAAAFREGIAEGVITSMGDASRPPESEPMPGALDISQAYAFAHDRIQQAAYALLSSGQRTQTHLKIGRLMQDRLPPARQKEMLFKITSHLNLGMPLIKDPGQRLGLCRLNLKAGKRAISANAYQPAFEHLKTALHLTDESIWDSDYTLALALYSEAAEAAYLTGAYDEMDQMLAIGFAHGKGVLDKVKLFQVKISACMARGQLIDAIDTAKTVLAQLGHPFPARPKQWHVIAKLLRLKWRLRRTSIDDLRNLPEMTDPNHLATMRIGERIGGAAMFAQPNLLPLLIMHAMELVADHGHMPQGLSIIAAFGMILAESLGEVDRGQAFGLLALELTQRLWAKDVGGRVCHVYNAMVRHWKEPLGNSLAPLHEAFLACLENGDFEYAAHAAVIRLFYAYEAGMNLSQLFDDLKACHATLKPLKQGPRIWYLESELQCVDNLLGNSADPSQLKGAYYDADKMLPLYRQFSDNSLIFTDRLNQIRLSYLFGRYDRALELCGRDQTRISFGLQGMFVAVTHRLMDSLVRLANVPGSNRRVRKRLLRQVAGNHRAMKRWAKQNPANCQNKVHLVEAERLRVLGRHLEAHEMFDSAIRLARQQDFIHEEALGYELCGAMHINAGRLLLGEAYLARARDLYRHWGATAKVNQLERRYPEIIGKDNSVKKATTSLGAIHAKADIGSLIKALKAIAEETAHSRMVAAIIETAMAFAGAQRGMLLLRNQAGMLCIEAESSVDGGDTRILQAIPITDANLSRAVVNYVNRIRSGIVIHDAQQPNDQIPGLNKDPYIQAHRTRSVLCLPILTGQRAESDLIGMLYLENNRSTATFTQERFDTLEIICLSAAGRLELSRKAVMDGLTGLYNHEYFKNILNQEFASARHHGHDLCLIMIDIDHFKRFNDTWGHQVGDLVLREVAQVIKSSCRKEDTIARYGGEEIAVILPTTGRDNAARVAERVRSGIENHRIAHSDESLSVTVSLGLAVLDKALADQDALIRCADTALYRSKAQGRNRLTVY